MLHQKNKVGQKKENWNNEEECRNAIPILVARYGKEIGSDYESILRVVECKNYDLQGSILEYADKLDALLETFHELYSGSKGFLSSMKEHFHKDMTCWEYIVGRVERRYKKLEDVYGKTLPKDGIFNISGLSEIDIHNIVSKGKPHLQDTIFDSTSIEMYDTWKRLHKNFDTPEQTSYLYTQHQT